MNTKSVPEARSLGELIALSTVPRRAVGIFWLGGASLVLKSSRQQVYLVDPAFSEWDGTGPAGAIDVRPDMVLCSLKAPEALDLSTLRHLASAFPEARFVGSAKTRDWMIGRGTPQQDEVPIDPAKVHAIEHDMRLDVRQVWVSDAVKLHIVPPLAGETEAPWNVLFNFSGLLVYLLREVSGAGQMASITDAVSRRVDVLVWTLAPGNLEAGCDLVEQLRPRYAIPVGHDLFSGGKELARRFRDVAASVPGVKVYLFAEDYLEGLLYSRIMSRRK